MSPCRVVVVVVVVDLVVDDVVLRSVRILVAVSVRRRRVPVGGWSSARDPAPFDGGDWRLRQVFFHFWLCDDAGFL